MHPIMLKYIAEARMQEARHAAPPKFETTRIRRGKTKVANRRPGFAGAARVNPATP